MSSPERGRPGFYYKAARDVLESRDMLVPNGPLQLYKPEPACGLESSAVFYTVASPSLSRQTFELLVLFATPIAGAELQAVLAIRRRLNLEQPTICVTPSCTEQVPAEIRVWSPNELFRKIFEVSDLLPNQFRDAAMLQRATEFPYTYQPREAIIRSTPDGGAVRSPQELDPYLKRWLQDRNRPNPILLLGERGSGKSWQAVRFVLDALALNTESPWQYGPALFVRLSELVNLLDRSTAATPVLCEYIFREYPRLASSFDRTRACGALLSSRHAVICADGFDEMDALPSDSSVRARFSSLLSILTKRTKFLMTCRHAHFSSLSALLNIPAWPGIRVEDSFEVLELKQFDQCRKRAYLDAVGKSLARVQSGVDLLDEGSDPLRRGLAICTRSPGLLAQIYNDTQTGITEIPELIERAVRESYTEHNIKLARTYEDYQTPGGAMVDLSIERREQLLADLAWYITTRHMPYLDLKALPLRFREAYGITNDALERDLRSQTVLEVVPPEARDSSTLSDESRLAFTYPRDGSTPESTSAERTSLVRFALHDEKKPPQDSDSSVAGAHYLARYIAAQLNQFGPSGPLSPEIRLSFLGRVHLGPLVCGLLREHLRNGPKTAEAIAQESRRTLVELARQHKGRVFSPTFRYLAENLATLQVLSRREAERINPWNVSVKEAIRPPDRISAYEMAIVPPDEGSGRDQPYLMGVHEVTNRQYRQFLANGTEAHEDKTIDGREWTVSRMTRAGAGNAGEQSANHVLSNEYHLFFWLPTGPEDSENQGVPDSINYRPSDDQLDHPVTYVSWYACAAFCDWLSVSESRARHYKNELWQALRRETCEIEDDAQFGYRLPCKAEWFSTARGGHPDLQWPWELFPYYLSPEQREASVTNPDALEKYNCEQAIVKKLLLDTGKRSYPVLYDEPNELGVSGLIGNVREWCGDLSNQERDSIDGVRQRLVLGSTGYLGSHTFDLSRGKEYSAPLYPRNTNPDVGFRLARSLRPSEIRCLSQREQEISDAGT